MTGPNDMTEPHDITEPPDMTEPPDTRVLTCTLVHALSYIHPHLCSSIGLLISRRANAVYIGTNVLDMQA